MPFTILMTRKWKVYPGLLILVDASLFGDYITSLVIVHNSLDFLSLSISVTNLVVLPNTCNDANVTEFSISAYSNLKTLVIGDNCFANVGLFSIMGLSNLISITIGDNSFSASFSAYNAFQISDCAKLSLLSIGKNSFTSFSSFALHGYMLYSILS